MNILLYIPVVLFTLIGGAHFLRQGNLGAVGAIVLVLGLLFIRRTWVRIVYPILLAGSAILWLSVGYEFIQIRMALQEPWGRLAIILGAVSLFTLLTGLVFATDRFKKIYRAHGDTGTLSAAAFLLTGVGLSAVQLVVSKPMILLERFLVGGGWIEILLLSTYAGFIVEKMMVVEDAPVWRRRIWLLFCIGFFLQLLLGMLGVDRLLMGDAPHVAVPLIIAAGPVFRGDGLFMVFLFGATVLLVGPSWCSHLCYLGAFDQFAADRNKRARSLPRWTIPLRIGMLILVLAVPFVLRQFSVATSVAVGIGIGAGIIGIGVMLVFSRKMGAMVHCAVYCPIGLVANGLGKISPFRVRILDGCDGCGACKPACPMNALQDIHIERKSPGFNCTLCGDCLSKCNKNEIQYGFLSFTGPVVRNVYIVAIVVLHAVFLGVARA